jgi:hypothetical protein
LTGSQKKATIMQDDFISSLTYEVKEEILERYFYERRLIEMQIDYVRELAQQAQKLEQKLRLCFAQLYKLLIDNNHLMEFTEIIGLETPPFKQQVKYDAPEYQISFIRKFRALTIKGKFKKVLFEAYQKLRRSAEEYRPAYENLREECKAVNYNIREFEKNHDLMVIINFLQSMDSELVMKKYFLGANFTPEEIGAVGNGLAFKKLHIKQFQLTKPPEIPDIGPVHKPLTALAGAIYAAHTHQVKAMLRQKT